MSRAAVLGSGLMGRALAYDLCRQPGIDTVEIIDISSERLDEARTLIDSPKASFRKMSIEDRKSLTSMLTGIEITFGAVSYQYNHMLSEICIDIGSHFVDLGGNDSVVDRQFDLNAKASAKGVSIIPDCGLAPGLAGILAMDLFNRFEKCFDLHLRVGGLPANPMPPLNYMLVFSIHGLINEYKEPVRIIKDGSALTTVGMSGLEEMEFPKPFGKLEAFLTSGGISTLVKILQGKVNNLEYKTIRYPGHHHYISFLNDTGFFDEGKMLNGISPREMTEVILTKKLEIEGEDLVLLKVTGSGLRGGKKETVVYEMTDRFDKKNGLSSMMRTTAFPAAIIGGMVLNGQISQRGVLHKELVVPAQQLIDELEKRGVKIIRNSGNKKQ